MGNINWYPSQKAQMAHNIKTALEMTGEAIHTDLVQSQTLPFREGNLQSSVFVDRTKSSLGHVAVVTSTPYARRLYFHPEYNFYKGSNAEAGGEWYKPYLTGSKKNFPKQAFSTFLKQRMG